MKRRDCLKALAHLPFAGLTIPLLAASPGLHAENRLKRVYAQPSPELLPALPRDHGAHPEFRTEWWYFTGWFESPEHLGPLGVQITFFRSAPDTDVNNPSAFAPKQLLLAHAAVAMPSREKLIHSEIIRRAGTGGAEIKPTDGRVLNIQMPGWQLHTANGDEWQCSIQTPQLGLSLQIAQTQPPWMQGRGGFSQKGPLPEQSSYYITMPHMQSTGTLRMDGKNIPIKGNFWMDHEWSSTVLAPNAQGWDWVGLHGSKGEALMAFQIRDREKSGTPIWTHAALRQSDGSIRQFKQVKFETQRSWQSNRTGVQYPVSQRLILDDLIFSLEPLFDDQELDSRASSGTLYWEGAVRVKSHSDNPWGQGYLEMTGYDKPMQL